MKIYTYPDPILKKYAKPIKDIDDEVQALADKMIATMYDAPGIGLAANQVGELKRMIVFELHPREEGRKPSVLINPEIVLSEGEITREEACLSVLDSRLRLPARRVSRYGEWIATESRWILKLSKPMHEKRGMSVRNVQGHTVTTS